jgi:hypothetical protein
LLIQALVSLLHISFTFYVFACMQKPFDASRREDASMKARFHHLLCWDPWFAVYILVALFELVWLIMGSVWIDEASGCDSSTHSATLAFLVIGWVYLSLGFLIFWCSWCCDCVSDRVAYANTTLQRQFEPYRDVESGNARRTARQNPVVQGTAFPANPSVQSHTPLPTAPPVVIATALPSKTESDSEMASRLQREEDARGVQAQAPPPSHDTQAHQQQAPTTADNLAAAGRTAFWGAKLVGTAAVAVGSAVATTVAEERRRAQEEEARRLSSNARK